MDVIQSIHRLQQKPEPVRRRILVVVVASCMFVVIGAWLAAESRIIAETSIANKKSEQEHTVQSPFALINDLIVKSKTDAEEFFKLFWK